MSLKEHWNYDLNQFKHRGRFLTRKDCLEYGDGNDYKQAHDDSRNLIKTTGTPIDLRVHLDDYDRCVDPLNGVSSIDLVRSYTQLLLKLLNSS